MENVKNSITESIQGTN